MTCQVTMNSSLSVTAMFNLTAPPLGTYTGPFNASTTETVVYSQLGLNAGLAETCVYSGTIVGTGSAYFITGIPT